MSTLSSHNGRIHIYPDNMTELNELLGIDVEELFPMIYPTSLPQTKTMKPSQKSQQLNQNTYLFCLHQANSASIPHLAENRTQSTIKTTHHRVVSEPVNVSSPIDQNDDSGSIPLDTTQPDIQSPASPNADISSHKPRPPSFQKPKLRASSRQVNTDDDILPTSSNISNDESIQPETSQSSHHLSVKTCDEEYSTHTTPPVTPAHSISVGSQGVSTPRQDDPLSSSGIIVRRQNTSSWGHVRIDRYGNFVPEPASDSNGQGEHSQDMAPSQSVSRLSTNQHLRAILPDNKSRERNKERERKWVQMLQHWQEFSTRKESKLKERIRKGIPPSARGAVWPLIMKISDIRSRYPQDYYRSLLDQEILREHDVQIRKDLPRLLQNHILFRSPDLGSRVVFSPGQATLYNVLKAYSIHDPDVGYVQGMDTLAAPALMYFPEELTFWYLERLLNSKKYGLRYNYIDGFPLAHQYVWVHERLVQRHLPRLYKAMEKAHVQHTGYAFRWYTMRYAQFAPELSFRILDIYLYEGDKILYRVALALLKQRMSTLMQDPDSMIEVLMEIENMSESHQADPLIASALKIDITTQEIRALEREYQTSMKIKIDRY